MTIRHCSSLLLVSVLLAAFASSLVSANPSTSPEDADLFKSKFVDVYIYQNQFFSFDMTIPGDWHVLSGRELLRRLRKGSRGGDYSDQNLRESGLFFLLSINKYDPAKPGQREEINPVIMLSAMDLSKHPGIKTGKDYLRFLTTSGKVMSAKGTLNPSSEQLGGVEFWRLHGRARRGSEAMNLEWIATVRKGCALMFQLAAGSKLDMTKLEDIMKSLHFD